ncbi:hypothetical protein WEH80_28620 [Actinomycetes bacterium KLBMP 9759]
MTGALVAWLSGGTPVIATPVREQPKSGRSCTELVLKGRPTRAPDVHGRRGAGHAEQLPVR